MERIEKTNKKGRASGNTCEASSVRLICELLVIIKMNFYTTFMNSSIHVIRFSTNKIFLSSLMDELTDLPRCAQKERFYYHY